MDDEEDLATLLHELLTDAGYDVATAPDGAVALDLVTTHEPALIIADLRMPIVDGSSFVAQYRRHGGRARVIVLTAVGAIDADQIGGAYALVRKPFEIDALLTTVAAALASSDDVQASRTVAAG